MYQEHQEGFISTQPAPCFFPHNLLAKLFLFCFYTSHYKIFKEHKTQTNKEGREGGREEGRIKRVERENKKEQRKEASHFFCSKYKYIYNINSYFKITKQNSLFYYPVFLIIKITNDECIFLFHANIYNEFLVKHEYIVFSLIK